MKRAVFLATTAFLAMLILVPIALAQDTTNLDSSTTFGTTVIGDGIPTPCGECSGIAAGGGGFRGTTMVNGSPSPPLTPETGGSAILLPAAALLLGSGILTYAFLRRR